MDMNALEEQVGLVIGYLVPLVEACGALVVMVGVVRTIIAHLRRLSSLDLVCVAGMRTQLAGSMVVGLEFQVAADILRTALSPTWNDILLLAALIGLRAVLSYLLDRELHTLCSDEETEGARAQSRQ
jgi:uncharacterized membrane protein